MRPIDLERRITLVPGCMPGLGRPSLHASLVVSLPATSAEEQVARLDAAFLPLLGTAPATEPQAAALPQGIVAPLDRLLAWNQRVQQAGGWPTTTAGFVSEKPADAPSIACRHLIAVPILDGCEHEAGDALRWVVDVASAALADQATTSFATRLAPLLARLRAVAPQGMNTLRFLEAADRRGIPWRRVCGNVYQFGNAAAAHWLDSSATEQSAWIAASLARDKYAASVVLRRAGLPVPDHEVVATIDDAVMAAGRIGYPVVVKPVDRDGGKGVAVDLDSPAAVRAAAAAVLRLSRGVLVERFVPGTDYRLQVHRGEVIWASQRTPGGVTGDGVHSVATLLERLNADPKRDPTAVATLLKQIPLDEEARELLARQGLTPDAVPEAGRFVRLRRAANVAMGGTAEGVLDRVHPDNRELAVRAAEALRLDLAGIDLIIPDIARSWLEGGAGICEVNAQPQLWPTLPELILKRLIRGTGRIPVTVVVGTPEQAPWAAAFAAALTARGEPTGWVSRSGATLGATTIMPGPLDLFVGGEAVFFDRRVRGVILFVEDDRVLRTGLPCDRCDRLVLVGGPAHAAAWPAWLGVARFLAAMCAGDIVVRDDDPRWRPLAAMLPGRRLTPLPIAEINRMMGRPHVA